MKSISKNSDSCIIDLSFLDEKNEKSNITQGVNLPFLSVKNTHVILPQNNQDLSHNKLNDGISNSKKLLNHHYSIPAADSTSKEVTSADKNTDDVLIEIDPLTQRILSCTQASQLDELLAEIIPSEDQSIDVAMQRMRIYADKHRQITQDSNAIYRAYMYLHQKLEKLLPYPFRAGGNVSLHLLVQTLFFDGQFHSKDASAAAATTAAATTAAATTSTPTAEPPSSKGFLSAHLALSLDQVRAFGDTMTALLFHFPTIVYQYPKLRDEINQCIEKRAISGSLISRLVMVTASTLLTISPLTMLSGSMQIGGIIRQTGRAISYLDIPIVVASLLQSWYQLYKYGSPNNSNVAQRFLSQEIAFKTTLRVLTQALSLASSLAGTILRMLGKGTAPEVLSLFLLNIVNLCFHQNPFEGVTLGTNLLKRPFYQHSDDISNVQKVALLIDFTKIPEIVAPLENHCDQFGYAFNFQRVSPESQLEILKKVITACSSGDRASINSAQAKFALCILEDIYGDQFDPNSLDLLPIKIQSFLIYLNKLRTQDRSCLSMGNAVNEYLLVVLIKTLAFRETLQSSTDKNQDR